MPDAPIAADDVFAAQQGMTQTTVTGNLGLDNGNGADFDPDGTLLGWVAGSGYSPTGDGDRYLGSWFSGGQLGFLHIMGTLSYPFPVWVTDTVVQTAQGGRVVLNTDGTFTYQSALGFSGTDTFSYVLVDGDYTVDLGMVTIHVGPTEGANDRPVAADDAFVTDEDRVLSGNLLADNGGGADTDPDGDALAVRAETVLSQAGGIVRIYADGSFTYTPRAGFSGNDSFAYTLRDPGLAEDRGTVTLTVLPVNDAPVAQDDAFSLRHDGVLTAGVLGNDSDPDGPGLAVVAGVFASAQGGTVTLRADGTFDYVAPTGHVGVDSFGYTVTDGSLADTGTVTLTLTNAGPVAQTDTVAVGYGRGATGSVLGNDSDADDDALQVVAATQVSARGGVFAVAADGSFTWTPGALFWGTESFTYLLRDGFGGQSTGTVTLTVAAPAGAWSGGAGYDNWTGASGNDIAVLAGGDDRGSGGLGNDAIGGGEGRDTLSGEAGRDALHGQGDKDVLRGGDGADSLYGGDGDDDLGGGAGADVLHGGAGADRMSGGGGADRFVFGAPGGAADRIADFTALDRLVFQADDLGLGAGPLAEGWVTSVGDADAGHARFAWNAGTKSLYWDADGTSSTSDVLICTFATKVTLTEASFLIL